MDQTEEEGVDRIVIPAYCSLQPSFIETPQDTPSATGQLLLWSYEVVCKSHEPSHKGARRCHESHPLTRTGLCAVGGVLYRFGLAYAMYFCPIFRRVSQAIPVASRYYRLLTGKGRETG